MTSFFSTSQMNEIENQTVKQLFWNEGFSYSNIFFKKYEELSIFKSILLDSVMYSTRVKRIPLS